MKIDPEDVKLVNRMLWKGEKVFGTFSQRRIGPGGSVTVPTSVVLTDMRVLIINRATLGLRHDYEVIPYPAIMSVRLEHGMISSSVFIRVQGYDTDKGFLNNGKQEGEIDGLHNDDAIELADFINKQVQQLMYSKYKQGDDIDIKVGGYVFCRTCGAKNPSGSKFCGACGKAL